MKTWVSFALALAIVLTGCSCSAKPAGTTSGRAAGGSAAGASAATTLTATSRGYIVSNGTTYAPTGASVRRDAAKMTLIGTSPNGRKFYVVSDSPAPTPAIYLHTGKVFYDVWEPLGK